MRGQRHLPRGRLSVDGRFADESGSIVGSVERRFADESGSIVGSVAGVMIFLSFLLLAAQVAIHLYGVSTVTARAFDLTRRVASDPAVTCRDVEEDASTRSGYLARPGVTVDCDDGDPEEVRLTVRGPSPARLVAGFGRVAGVDTVHRTVRVRVEDFVVPVPP